jgi:tRNA A37 N6-isopentenylltransferase MiaA
MCAIRFKDTEMSLAHYGVQGQKWGVRRFQNEDGTLTEEGKARYLESLTDRQKNIYSKMPEKNKRRVEKKLAEGKSWTQSISEMNKETQRKIALRNLGITAAVMYMNPTTRPIMKSAGRMILRVGKTGVRAIANSRAVQKGAQYLQRMMKRWASKKGGAVTLNKSQYSVRDTVIPFGGFLKG